MRPEPPDDLWEILEALNEEAGIPVGPIRPPGAFTAKEYAKRFGMSHSTAARRLTKLAEAGKVNRHGVTGTGVCYTVVKKI